MTACSLHQIFHRRKSRYFIWVRNFDVNVESVTVRRMRIMNGMGSIALKNIEIGIATSTLMHSRGQCEPHATNDGYTRNAPNNGIKIKLKQMIRSAPRLWSVYPFHKTAQLAMCQRRAFLQQQNQIYWFAVLVLKCCISSGSGSVQRAVYGLTKKTKIPADRWSVDAARRERGKSLQQGELLFYAHVRSLRFIRLRSKLLCFTCPEFSLHSYLFRCTAYFIVIIFVFRVSQENYKFSELPGEDPGNS